ncbi:MAG TPA: sigma-54 dependent transcriptional regulator [Gemmatimonadales bacterium]|nr:sigma-54 dependent transcriptional regulator [Gemmatimonadales bacterium]
MPAVLVLDQLGSFHSFAREALAQEGYKVLWGQSPHEAISALVRGRFAAVLVDVCVPNNGLLHGVESVIRMGSGAHTVVVTGCPLMAAAARVLYPEADGFLQKPCTPEELRSLVAGRPEAPSSGYDPGLPFHGIVGTSPGIRRVIEQILEVAPTESTILITGETGAGKELVAAAIHECSNRRDRPYVVVDTPALSETLLESEFFGHTKGSFTGAVRDKPGLFEAADGGTIFLDEVGDIPPAVQIRLLRVIQEREVRRLGAVQPAKVDVRVIAATQWDLVEAVRSSRLRADLYYRLSVYTIKIPPLRERTEDIPALVEYALRTARSKGGQASGCRELALQMLQCYHWPGNVRELLAVLERTQISARGDQLAATDLPERIRVAWREKVLSGDESQERAAIIQALKEVKGHRGKAAEVLGVSRTTLWRWLTRYGLE